MNPLSTKFAGSFGDVVIARLTKHDINKQQHGPFFALKVFRKSSCITFETERASLSRLRYVDLVPPMILTEPAAYRDVKNIPDLIDTCTDNRDRHKAALVLPLIAQRAIQWVDLPRFVYGVASALREVHERGLVHRDIKLGNLLWGCPRLEGGLKEPASAYVIDFGLTYDSGAAVQRPPAAQLRDGPAQPTAKLKRLLSKEKSRRRKARQHLDVDNHRRVMVFGTRTYRAPEALISKYVTRVMSGM